MIKSKKQMYLVIGVFTLVLLLGTTTYAFFNYTRTGASNIIKTGRIYFNSEQGNTINIENVFPIDKAETGIMDDATKVGTVTINVVGDTTYSGGVEYLVSAVNINNSVSTSSGTKNIPISVDVSYTSSENKSVGTLDNHYFDNRGGEDSLYKVLAGNVIYNNAPLAVGYIAEGQTGIDGTITIKAFVDKDRIAISDTYSSNFFSREGYNLNKNMTQDELALCISKVQQYYPSQTSEEYQDYCRGVGMINGKKFIEHINGGYYGTSYKNYFTSNNIIIQYENETTEEWVKDREVFTTDEWNSLNTNGISFAVKVEANEGIWVAEKGNAMKSKIEDGTFDSSVLDNIKVVYFNNMDSSEMQEAYDDAELKIDLTHNGEGKVLGWFETNTEDNTKYTMYIASDGKTDFPSDATDLFYNLKINKAEEFVFNNVNTSGVINMYDMFYNCTNVKSLDLTSFDTSSVTSTSYMFYNMPNLETVNMSNLDMRKVTNMQSMFSGTPNLTTVNFTNSKTRDVTNMYNMFAIGCTKLESINLDGFGGDNLSNLSYFVPDSIKHISMKNFNFGTAYIGSLFTDYSNLIDVDLSGSIINSASVYNLFKNDSKLTNVNLNNVKFNGLNNATGMFSGCTLLTDIDISSIDFSNLEVADEMFKGSSSLTTIKVSSGTDLSNINSGSAMFSGCTSLVGGNGTIYDSGHIDKGYAVIDTNDTPGYFTLKTN